MHKAFKIGILCLNSFPLLTAISCGTNVENDSIIADAPKLENVEHTFIDGWAVDGDTIGLERTQLFNPKINDYSYFNSLRIYNIDTPESRRYVDGVWYETTGIEKVWATKAAEVLQSLSGNMDAYSIDVDVYDRLVATIYSGDIDIATHIVSLGLARLWYNWPPYTDAWKPENQWYVEGLDEAQEKAKKENLGLWSLSEDDYALVFP